MPSFREMIDIIVHPLRRALVRRHLSKRRPTSILFVCQGNLCRSPYGAALLRRLVEEEDEEFDVASAGFQTEIPTPPRVAIEAAAARGVDLADHVAQQVSRTLMRNRQLVVVMEPAQSVRLQRTFRGKLPRIVVLGDLDPLGRQGRTIVDPIGKPRMQFDVTFARLDRCITELAELVRNDQTDTIPLVAARYSQQM